MNELTVKLPSVNEYVRQWIETGKQPSHTLILEIAAQSWKEGLLPESRKFEGPMCIQGYPSIERMKISAENGAQEYGHREAFIKEFGFSIPQPEAVNELAKKPLLEIGAGSGYWAKLVELAGGDVIATDRGPSKFGFKFGDYFPVIKRSAASAVRKLGEGRNVFVSWPSYDERWAADALPYMRSGRKLYFIGEGQGGCTANDKFFDLLYGQFEKEGEIDIPYFWGLHDTSMEIWRKK